MNKKELIYKIEMAIIEAENSSLEQMGIFEKDGYINGLKHALQFVKEC